MQQLLRPDEERVFEAERPEVLVLACGAIAREVLAIIDLNEAKMAEVADEVRRIGRKATTFVADVTKRDEVYAAVEHTESALDGFAAIAFAASLGWGVGASVLALLVVQGSLTALGAALGDVLSDAQVAALTTTGGLLLVGVALRLLRLKQLPVGDLLPALLVAPVLTAVVAALH